MFQKTICAVLVDVHNNWISITYLIIVINLIKFHCITTLSFIYIFLDRYNIELISSFVYFVFCFLRLLNSCNLYLSLICIFQYRYNTYTTQTCKWQFIQNSTCFNLGSESTLLLFTQLNLPQPMFSFLQWLMLTILSNLLKKDTSTRKLNWFHTFEVKTSLAFLVALICGPFYNIHQ